MDPVAQDRTLELRYSRHADFTDEVVREYLSRLPSPEQVGKGVAIRDLSRFVRPYVDSQRS